MTWVAVGTAAVGIVSGISSSNQQSKAMQAQQQAAQQQLQLEQQFMQQQNQLYGPLMQQYVQQASGGAPLDYGLISGGIQGGYDAAQRNLQSQLASRGLSASGLAGAGATGLEIGRAGALSQAFQQGLDRRRQLGLNVLQHYNPGANVQGVAGAFGNMQNLYGQYAGMYGQAAQGAYGSAASALGNAAKGFMMQPAPQTPDVSGSINAAQPLPAAPQYQPMNLQAPPPLPVDYSSTQFEAPQQPPLYNGQPFQPASPTPVQLGYGATTTGATN